MVKDPDAEEHAPGKADGAQDKTFQAMIDSLLSKIHDNECP